MFKVRMETGPMQHSEVWGFKSRHKKLDAIVAPESMKNSSIVNRGLFYCIAILFNQLVPAGLFRLGIMDIYQLSLQKLNRSDSPGNFTIDFVSSGLKREELKGITKNGFPEGITLTHKAVALHDCENGEMVGGLWVACNHFVEYPLNFLLEFSPRQAWIYSAYILPGHRMQGHYSACLRFVAGELESCKRDELLVAFNPFNKASAAAHQKYAKRRLGRIWSIRLFGLAMCFRTGAIRKTKTFATRGSLAEFSVESD